MAAFVNPVRRTLIGRRCLRWASGRHRIDTARKCVLPVPGGPQMSWMSWSTTDSNACSWLGVSPASVASFFAVANTSAGPTSRRRVPTGSATSLGNHGSSWRSIAASSPMSLSVL
jgi:hypothetical protein